VVLAAAPDNLSPDVAAERATFLANVTPEQTTAFETLERVIGTQVTLDVANGRAELTIALAGVHNATVGPDVANAFGRLDDGVVPSVVIPNDGWVTGQGGAVGPVYANATQVNTFTELVRAANTLGIEPDVMTHSNGFQGLADAVQNADRANAPLALGHVTVVAPNLGWNHDGAAEQLGRIAGASDSVVVLSAQDGSGRSDFSTSGPGARIGDVVTDVQNEQRAEGLTPNVTIEVIPPANSARASHSLDHYAASPLISAPLVAPAPPGPNAPRNVPYSPHAPAVPPPETGPRPPTLPPILPLPPGIGNRGRR
jgi:hypothetical protein